MKQANLALNDKLTLNKYVYLNKLVSMLCHLYPYLTIQLSRSRSRFVRILNGGNYLKTLSAWERHGMLNMVALCGK